MRRDTPCWVLNAGSGARLHPAGCGEPGRSGQQGSSVGSSEGSRGREAVGRTRGEMIGSGTRKSRSQG